MRNIRYHERLYDEAVGRGDITKAVEIREHIDTTKNMLYQNQKRLENER